MFHNAIKKIIFVLLLVVLLNSQLYYNFFYNRIFFTIIAGQCHYMTKYYLNINFISFFIWFIRLSVKFFNNVWYIQNAHELHIKICFFLSLCPLFFIKFLFFHQMIALQKLWTMFLISSKKLFWNNSKTTLHYIIKLSQTIYS